MVTDAVRAEIQQLIAKAGADVAVAFRTLDGRDELFIAGGVERPVCLPPEAL